VVDLIMKSSDLGYLRAYSPPSNINYNHMGNISSVEYNLVFEFSTRHGDVITMDLNIKTSEYDSALMEGIDKIGNSEE